MHPAFRDAATAIAAALVLLALASVVTNAPPARAAANCATIDDTINHLSRASKARGAMDARVTEMILEGGVTMLYAGSEKLPVMAFLYGADGCFLWSGASRATWSRYWLSHPVAMSGVRAMSTWLLHAREI